MTAQEARRYGRYLTDEESEGFSREYNEVINPLKADYRKEEKLYRNGLKALFDNTITPNSIRIMVLIGDINNTDFTPETKAAVIAYHMHEADKAFWSVHPYNNAEERHQIEDEWAASIGWNYPMLKLIATTELYWRLVEVMDRIADAYDDLPETREEFMRQVKKIATKRIVTDNYKLTAIGIIHRATAKDIECPPGDDSEDTLRYLEDLADLEGTPYSDRPYIWDSNLEEMISVGFDAYCDDTQSLNRVANNHLLCAVELRIKAQGINAIRYDHDNTMQTSSNPNKSPDIFSQITELEQSSQSMNREYIKRAQEFSRLCNLAGLDAQETYAASLYYIKGAGFADIAREMRITPDRARYLATGYSKQIDTRERLLRAIAIEYVKAHTDWIPGSHPERIYEPLPDMYWAGPLED